MGHQNVQWGGSRLRGAGAALHGEPEADGSRLQPEPGLPGRSVHPGPLDNLRGADRYHEAPRRWIAPVGSSKAVPCLRNQPGRDHPAVGSGGSEGPLEGGGTESGMARRPSYVGPRRIASEASPKRQEPLLKLSGIWAATTSPRAVTTPLAETVASTTTRRPLISFTRPRISSSASRGVGFK